MKSNIKLSFLLISIVLFTTCKKEIRYTFVEGIAQDYYTKEPIAEAEVELFGPGGDAYGFITSVYTDANGHFEFEKFRAEKSGDYSINIEGTGYNSQPKYGQHNIEKGKKNMLIPTIVKACRIGFKLLNQTPYDVNDKICLTLDISEDIILNENVTSFSPPCIVGQQIFNDAGPSVSANTNFYLKYTVTKNAMSQSFTTQFIVKKDSVLMINY
jgi:hypothetical protein